VHKRGGGQGKCVVVGVGAGAGGNQARGVGWVGQEEGGRKEAAKVWECMGGGGGGGWG